MVSNEERAAHISGDILEITKATKLRSVYILGARQRSRILKTEEEWNLYESAVLIRLDIETGRVQTCVEYKTPPEARAHDLSSNVFKSATLVDDKLFACTSTEVLVFKVPSFDRIGYISLPMFNDLHHVRPSLDGNLLVVSTGLDMVIKCTPQGVVLQEWSALGEDPWSRFSRETDYRKVESTKPHRSHPNFVFELKGQVWVTRFHQKDAVCLQDRAKRIEIAIQRPHDGSLFGDQLYFTTVDGRIVVANSVTLKLEKIIDLRTFGDSNLLGWCRGVLPIDNRRMWVGFTRVRKTRFKENILWARSLLREGAIEQPTRVALYDVVEGRCLREFNLEPHGLNLVFSILAGPEVREKVSRPQSAAMALGDQPANCERWDER